MRIEDTDQERSQEKFVTEILDAMTWLGLDWDEGPYRQMERLPIYQDYINRLLAERRGLLLQLPAPGPGKPRQAALARGEKPKYDGHCRDRNLPAGPDTAIRFKTPRPGSPIGMTRSRAPSPLTTRNWMTWCCNGPTAFPPIISRWWWMTSPWGSPTSSGGKTTSPTPPGNSSSMRPWEWRRRYFAHMPLMLGKDRAKLSKRHGAVFGYGLPGAGLPAPRLGELSGPAGLVPRRPGDFSREELIDCFTLDHVTKSPGVFDEEKLQWLNSHYIKEMPPPELARALTPFLAVPGVRSPGPGVSGPGGDHPERPEQDPGGDGGGRPFLFPGPPAVRSQGGPKIPHPGRGPRDAGDFGPAGPACPTPRKRP